VAPTLWLDEARGSPGPAGGGCIFIGRKGLIHGCFAIGLGITGTLIAEICVSITAIEVWLIVEVQSIYD